MLKQLEIPIQKKKKRGKWKRTIQFYKDKLFFLVSMSDIDYTLEKQSKLYLTDVIWKTIYYCKFHFLFSLIVLICQIIATSFCIFSHHISSQFFSLVRYQLYSCSPKSVRSQHVSKNLKKIQSKETANLECR